MSVTGRTRTNRNKSIKQKTGEQFFVWNSRRAGCAKKKKSQKASKGEFFVPLCEAFQCLVDDVTKERTSHQLDRRLFFCLRHHEGNSRKKKKKKTFVCA
jgi:hypothetical protein